MKEQLDLVKILKDCPKGMELDCTMYDNVTLKSVSLDINNGYPICIETKHGFNTKLTKYGQNICINDAKCVIFPKGKTTWEGFQKPFVDGDIVFYDNCVSIFKEWGDETLFRNYVKVDIDGRHPMLCDRTCSCGKGIKREARFATEKEKEKLFQTIKNNGYEWNPETKTLEKLIVPKFKIRDKIKHKNDKTVITIIEIKDDYYYMQFYNARTHLYQNEKVLFKDQDQYELIPNKFNPKILQPFDKVLVKQHDVSTWCADFYSYYDEVGKYVECTGGIHYNYCIPYNDDTKHLVGKMDEAPEFYRYWEN